jgi:hypothetical protein
MSKSGKVVQNAACVVSGLKFCERKVAPICGIGLKVSLDWWEQ